MKLNFSRFPFAVFVIVSSFVVSIQAQSRGTLDVTAITNARIVTVSGAVVERGTIVVRDGLIQAVGANVAVPADARVIDGSGLTVYPGFFDAATNLGIAAPQRPQGVGAFPTTQPQPQTAPQSNSNYPVGLQPETTALELIRSGDASFETARNNGFTTALVLPRERIFVGQSALVNTAGENVSQQLLRSPVAMHITFVQLQTGTFPTSVMGTFAAIRQMLLDAQRLQTAQRIYAANPRGVRRPDSDKSLEALFPILSRQTPVVFNANSEREIIRALDLAREFNLLAMIAGGTEAWKVADRLKAQNIPVLLSLNFPKRTASASTEADPENMDVLRMRVEVPKNAARLRQAGVKFAFQSGSMTNLADFWTNAGKAVENGLPKDDAIRAMTLSTAEIFGMEKQLGTIEPGKIANLTVTRGDILDKSRTFTHVFVDGRMYEIRQPAARPDGRPTPGGTPGQQIPNIAGTWTLNIEIPGQPTQATLRLTQQEARLTGTLESPFGNSTITRGEVTAEGFTFSTTVTIQQTFDVVFTGRVTGNQMSGTATSPQGAIPFSGTRNP